MPDKMTPSRVGQAVLRRTDWLIRRLTSGARVLPDYLIIGTQRGGTTSLYNYLVQHPCVLPTFRKEIHFFDEHFANGLRWYQAFFPTQSEQRSGQNAQRKITGEASPYYLFHPLAASRVRATLPHAKLIVLLRNPISRAYSHYHHEVRKGREKLPFEEAILQEEQRSSGEKERILQDETYLSESHRRHSYLARGVYIHQLRDWLNHFPKEQLLILRSETLYEHPRETFSQVLSHLALPEWHPANYEAFNKAPYPQLSEETHHRLINYFEPFNKELEEFLQMELQWE
jgi:hypothetical protein